MWWMEFTKLCYTEMDYFMFMMSVCLLYLFINEYNLTSRTRTVAQKDWKDYSIPQACLLQDLAILNSSISRL